MKDGITWELNTTEFTGMINKEPLPTFSKSLIYNTIRIYNDALRHIFRKRGIDIMTINNLIYSFAKTETGQLGFWTMRETTNHDKRPPEWKQQCRRYLGFCEEASQLSMRLLEV